MVEVKSEKLDKIEEIIAHAKAMQILVVDLKKKHTTSDTWHKDLAAFIREAEKIRVYAVLSAYKKARKEG